MTRKVRNPVPSMEILAAAFDARRCVVCGQPASIVRVGSDAVYLEEIRSLAGGKTVRRHRLVAAAVDDVNLCLADAAGRWGKVA